MTASTYARNETALTQAVDRWNAGDLDGYLRFYDEALNRAPTVVGERGPTQLARDAVGETIAVR